MYVCIYARVRGVVKVHFTYALVSFARLCLKISAARVMPKKACPKCKAENAVAAADCACGHVRQEIETDMRIALHGYRVRPLNLTIREIFSFFSFFCFSFCYFDPGLPRKEGRARSGGPCQRTWSSCQAGVKLFLPLKGSGANFLFRVLNSGGKEPPFLFAALFLFFYVCGE